jgi:hypothetical protein
MTFEQRYGNCPPMGMDMEDMWNMVWKDRKAVWIKAQTEMRERCADLVGSYLPPQDFDLDDIWELESNVRSLEVE